MKIVTIVACVILVILFIGVAMVTLQGVFAPDEPVRHSNRGVPSPTETVTVEILDVAP